MSDAVSKFIAVVGLHFPRPKFADDETMETAWMASMRRALEGYDDAVLAAAAERIICTRKPKRDGRFFPVPSECTEACEYVCKLKEALATPLLAAPPSNRYEWRYKLADELILTPLGKQAGDEGWLLALHDFIRAHGRLPTQPWEITKCKASANGFDEAYETVLRGEGGVANAALERLGASMLARREAYREKVLGK